jgi:hypothetical protein
VGFFLRSHTDDSDKMGGVCCSDERDRACKPADDDYASEYYEYIARPSWPVACKPFRPSTPPLGRSASDLSVNSAYDGSTAPPPPASATAPRSVPSRLVFGSAASVTITAAAAGAATSAIVAPGDMVQL